MEALFRRAMVPALAFGLLLACLQEAAAQTPDSVEAAQESESWVPQVSSFVLRRAGTEILDPFGTSGRREVIQLMAQGSPLRGRFRRARMDRLDSEDWRIEGWYEIRGSTIRLYYMDEVGGASGRVDIGQYRRGLICLIDEVDGRTLSFEYLAPEGGNATPPPAPAGSIEATCQAGGAPRS